MKRATLVHVQEGSPRPVAPELPGLSDGAVRLRSFTVEDAPALAAIWADPVIRRRNSVPEPSEAAAIEWVLSCRERFAAGEAWEWAILDAITGQLAGRRALKDLRSGHRRAAAACWVASAFRGRRFAARSLRLVAQYAFGQGIVRIEAACEADNEPAMHSVLAAGMRHEGTLRSYFISNTGVPVDAEMFGLVPSDLAEPPHATGTDEP